MLKVHQNIIISNLSVLVEETDLNTLVPELLNKNVFNERMISRILVPSHNAKRQKTDLYIEILKRGPQAFAKLQDALISTNHLNLAEILKVMEAQSSQNPSVSSNGSRNLAGNDNDGSCISTTSQNQSSQSQAGTSRRPTSFLQGLPGKLNPFASRSQPRSSSDEGNHKKCKDLCEAHTPGSCDSEVTMFHPPAYMMGSFDKTFRAAGYLSPNDYINYTSEKRLPVRVRHAIAWQATADNKPLNYKMESIPRGHALLVNNMHFYNKVDYPDRQGAENDELRMTELMKQLHYEVESHKDKTKREMETIVQNFSQKPELNEVDSAFVIFMSHGQEGDSEEDSEIIGIDGMGLKVKDIVGYFNNDACKALINKPKVFFFQACRGSLSDPGVLIGTLSFTDRIVTDGKKVCVPTYNVKIRTEADIFIAYPVAPGRMANRDNITGAWFIQTIVDVFSEHAWNTHLEDLLKMVDERIKRMNNLHTLNFQTVTTKTIGWNKNLYFNPGLCRDKSGATLRLGVTSSSSNSDGGVDVVDTLPSNSSKNCQRNAYWRLKDDKDDSDDDRGCFDFFGCSAS